jgi:hypothetical protein
VTLFQPLTGDGTRVLHIVFVSSQAGLNGASAGENCPTTRRDSSSGGREIMLDKRANSVPLLPLLLYPA